MLPIKSKKFVILLLLLAVSILAAACSTKTPTLSPTLTPTSAPTGEATVPHLDELVEALKTGSSQALLPLIRFTTLPCSGASEPGGPPRCLSGEAEGTQIEVLPVISTDGFFFRRDEFAAWKGIGPATLYAAFRNTGGTFSDQNYPAGEYGVVFLLPDQKTGVIFQMTGEGVVRIDYHDLAAIASLLQSNKVVLGPFPVSY